MSDHDNDDSKKPSDAPDEEEMQSAPAPAPPSDSAAPANSTVEDGDDGKQNENNKSEKASNDDSSSSSFSCQKMLWEWLVLSVRRLCGFYAGLACLLNIINHMMIAVFGALLAVDLAVVLYFSAVVPSSAATAVAGVFFLAALLPWCVVILGCIFQWRVWLCDYSQLKASMFYLCWWIFKRKLDDDERKKLPKWEQGMLEDEEAPGWNARLLLQYSIAVVIWVITFCVAAASSGEYAMWFYFVTGTIWTVLNSQFDMASWCFYPRQAGIVCFVIFRNGSRYLEIYVNTMAILSLIAISSNDIDFVPGGKSAVAVSFVFMFLSIIISVIVLLVKPFGFASAGAPISLRNPIVPVMFARDMVLLFIGCVIVASDVEGVKSAVFFVFLALIAGVYISMLVWGGDEYVLLYEASDVKAAEREEEQLKKEETRQRGGVTDSAPDNQAQEEGGASQHQIPVEDLQKCASSSSAAAAGSSSSYSSPRKKKSQLFVSNPKDEVFCAAEAARIHRAQREVSREAHLSQFLKEIVGGGPNDGGENGGSPAKFDAHQFAEQQHQFAANREGIAQTDDEHSTLELGPDARAAGPLRIAYFVVCFMVFAFWALSLMPTSTGSVATSCPGEAPLPPTLSQTNMTAFSMCYMQFPTGVSSQPLSISDAASLIIATYSANKTRSIEVYFPGESAELLSEKSSTGSSSVAVNYFIARLPQRKVIIAGVRGSASSQDWIINVFRSIESIVVASAFSLMPLPQLDSVAAIMVQIAGSLKYGVELYAPTVKAELELAGARYPDHALYAMGHSAGGAVAGLVAATSTKTRAITLSGVGIGMTYRRFGFDTKHAANVITNLAPIGDIVPLIDKQVGSTQWFTTLDPCGSSNTNCHSSAHSLKTITTVCGDPLGRGTVSTEAEAANACKP